VSSPEPVDNEEIAEVLESHFLDGFFFEIGVELFRSEDKPHLIQFRTRLFCGQFRQSLHFVRRLHVHDQALPIEVLHKHLDHFAHVLFLF